MIKKIRNIKEVRVCDFCGKEDSEFEEIISCEMCGKDICSAHDCSPPEHYASHGHYVICPECEKVCEPYEERVREITQRIEPLIAEQREIILEMWDNVKYQR